MINRKKCGDDADAGDEGASHAPPLPQDVQDLLGLKLRRAYAEVVSEPLPDKFSKLLEQLANASKKEGAGS